ncbi:MAG: hypothetical protein KDC54_13490, partial [Lewinella sp.]|nr:hypothetical protein [Lewinella sp.]
MKQHVDFSLKSLLILFVLLLSAFWAAAQTTYTWTALSDGNWSPASPGSSVAAGDMVVINAPVTVTLDVATFTNNGTIIISNTADPQGNDDPAGGMLVVPDGTTFSNNAALWVYYFFDVINWVDGGYLTIEDGGVLDNTGTIEVFDGVVENYGTLNNSGAINGRLWGYLDNYEEINNLGTGMIHLYDDSAIGINDPEGDISNSGTIDIEANAAVFIEHGLQNCGTINNFGSVFLTGEDGIAGDALISNINGAFCEDDGTFIQQGYLGGEGWFMGDLVNEGTVGPGFYGIGVLVVDGSFTNNGVLEIEISADGHDHLRIWGAESVVTLSGELRVTLLDGFLPDPAESFSIIFSTSIGEWPVSGEFTTGPGDNWLVFYNGFPNDYLPGAVYLVYTGATIFVWTGDFNDQWEIDANWEGGVSPGGIVSNTDEVYIDNRASGPVRHSIPINISGTLYIQDQAFSNEGPLDVYGTIYLEAPGQLTNTDDLNVWNHGRISNQGALINEADADLNLYNGSLVHTHDGGSLSNAGTITTETYATLVVGLGATPATLENTGTFDHA